MLDHGHEFVLTSRFTQDCLENLFSCIRQRNPVPTPVEFHQALKSVSVGQFLTTAQSGSYEEDDGSLLAEFLDIKETYPSPGLSVEQLIGNTGTPDLTNSETCILYHLTGYIVNKVIKHSNICDKCSSSIKQNDDSLEGEHSTLLTLKEFKPGVLCRPSHEAFSVIQKVERLFRTRSGPSFLELPNAMETVETEASLLQSLLPACHDVQKKKAVIVI
ncbi:uncharacterized protein LOC106523140 [Austrofundulus limnaeus]|uniref:Uncharacterized protein LOC106523140 n=1 Tax=Austrofundulus limnaeus TaxID=52670 RepID=A0A2I4BW17_AUSLI|nr:PREDICTED: uncharacterized protein LOC106523140 [Austrofundulus limnaeus]